MMNWKLVLVGAVTLAIHAQQVETLKITILEGLGSVNSIKNGEGCGMKPTGLFLRHACSFQRQPLGPAAK
jgi:hypothetical protein